MKTPAIALISANGSLVKSILLVFFTALTVSAQDTDPATGKPALPPGPLIQSRAPSFAKWTVTAKLSNTPQSTGQNGNATSPDPTKSQLSRVTFTKTDPIIHVELIDVQQKLWNIWVQGSLETFIWPDGRSADFVEKPPNPDMVNPLYMDFSKSDFQGFDWISPNNFQGVKDVDGNKCLIFQDVFSLPGGTPNPIIATIDLATRLPISFAKGDIIYTYQFQAPPVSMLTLPGNIQALIDKQQQMIQAFSRKPGKPF